MKKPLLVFLGIFFTAVIAQGQGIPNAGFEEWTNNTYYEDPNGWITFNSLTALVQSATVEKSIDKHSGNYAVKISTKTHTIGSPPFAKTDTLAGIAVSGSNGKPGFAYSGRPAHFNGYYKHDCPKGDTAFIVAYLYKWNTVKGKRDSLAIAYFYSASTVDTYVPFTAQFGYTSSTKSADTAVIIISSSGKKKLPGSVLYVDDLTFDVVTDVSESLQGQMVLAYPNPAKEDFSIANLPDNAANILVKDLTGRTIEEINATPITTFSTLNYPQGIYYYEVKDKSSSLLHSGKFCVTK